MLTAALTLQLLAAAPGLPADAPVRSETPDRTLPVVDPAVNDLSTSKRRSQTLFIDEIRMPGGIISAYVGLLVGAAIFGSLNDHVFPPGLRDFLLLLMPPVLGATVFGSILAAVDPDGGNPLWRALMCFAAAAVGEAVGFGAVMLFRQGARGGLSEASRDAVGLAPLLAGYAVSLALGLTRPQAVQVAVVPLSSGADNKGLGAVVSFALP